MFSQEAEQTEENLYMDAHPVTNRMFREFVRETKYPTEAERYGWSFVFKGRIPKEERKEYESVKEASWWLAVPGAYWRAPEGKGSGVSDRLDHPVTHVSLNDARFFCKWAGGHVPTDAEWDVAARGGGPLTEKKYPWPLRDSPRDHMNVWKKGKTFPRIPKNATIGLEHALARGPQNRIGMYNMLGGGWEWVDEVHYNIQEMAQAAKAGKEPEEKFKLRGGSYVDTVDGSANHQVDLTTVMGNSADAGSDNLQFRCAYEGNPDESSSSSSSSSSGSSSGGDSGEDDGEEWEDEVEL